METLGQYAFLAGSALQILAYLVLAVLALVRLGQRWAVIALLGALTSLVPTVWFAAANLSVYLSESSLDTVGFFYAPAAQLLMQFLTALGLVLLVLAVVVGRGPRKEAPPAEGPTGTTFRQLPGNIDWR